MGLYINPVLSDRDFGFFRIGGPGLANCMFVAARAAVLSQKLKVPMLRPTWERLGIGQWLRRERDKRFYSRLFNNASEICGTRKLLIRLLHRHVSEADAMTALKGVVDVSGLGRYFEDFSLCADEVRRYFFEHIAPSAIANVPSGKQDFVAIHVRLGDYPEHWRTNINWYVNVVKLVANRRCGKSAQRFWLFSDGTDEELEPLICMNNVERVYFGNAVADMVAISRSKLLIGSDSTFSAWGAFLGDIPAVFAHLHFGHISGEGDKEFVSGDFQKISNWLSGVES